MLRGEKTVGHMLQVIRLRLTAPQRVAEYENAPVGLGDRQHHLDGTPLEELFLCILMSGEPTIGFPSGYFTQSLGGYRLTVETQISGLTQWDHIVVVNTVFNDELKQRSTILVERLLSGRYILGSHPFVVQDDVIRHEGLLHGIPDTLLHEPLQIAPADTASIGHGHTPQRIVGRQFEVDLLSGFPARSMKNLSHNS